MCCLDEQLFSLCITLLGRGGCFVKDVGLCHKMGPGFFNVYDAVDEDWTSRYTPRHKSRFDGQEVQS